MRSTTGKSASGAPTWGSGIVVERVVVEDDNHDVRARRRVERSLGVHRVGDVDAGAAIAPESGVVH